MEQREARIRLRLGDLAVVRRIGGRKPETPVLYHYTKRLGLLGIIDSRAIHASNARYLNDALELSTATLRAREVIGARAVAPSPELGALYAAIEHFLKTLEHLNDVFVFSMSEDGDMLSQWRAYSEAGNGYAVGFDLTALQRAAEVELVPFYLAVCEYDETNQRDLVSLTLDEAEQTLRTRLAAGDEPALAVGHALTWFAAGFTIAAPTIKHHAFREEREWRLILPVSSVWDQRVTFRDGGALLVPFWKLPLAKGENKLPIAEVIVGPTPHPELEARAVSGLLTNAGLAGARVRNSTIPYRDW